MGPLRISQHGYQYGFVIIDHFSKFIHIRCIRNITADKIVKKTEQFFRQYGAPFKLLSDNGVQFTLHLKVYVLSIKLNMLKQLHIILIPMRWWKEWIERSKQC